MTKLLEESRVLRQLRKEVTENKLWEGKFIKPVKGRLSSPYGQVRTYGKSRRPGRHRGLDIAAPTGTVIKTPNNGVVKMIAKFKKIGNTVLINHGQGIYSVYMHLDEIKIKRTAEVKTGDIIGTVGSTGQATGPHLHWGIYVNGIAVNPLPWTKNEFN